MTTSDRAPSASIVSSSAWSTPAKQLMKKTFEAVPVRTLPVAALLIGGALGATRVGAVRPELAAAVILLAGIAVFRRRPDLGFLVWLFLAPYFQSFGRRSEAPVASAAKIGIYFAPPLVFAAWAALRMRRSRQMSFGSIVDLLPALFVVAAIGTVFLGPSRYGGYDRVDLLQQLYLSVVVGVLCFYVCLLAPFRGSVMKRAAEVILATSLVVSLMALIEKVSNWNLWHYTYWHTLSVPRVTGPLLSPAALGTFLGMAIVIAVAALLWPGPIRRELALAVIALGIPAILLTYQRASVLAVLAVVLAVLAVKPRVRLVVAGAVALGLVVLAAAWGPITHSHVYRSRISDTATVDIRTNVTEAGLRASGDRPFLGWGYGSFDVVRKSLPVGLGPKAELSEIFYAPSGRDGKKSHAVSPPIAMPSTLIEPTRSWVALRVRVHRSSRAALRLYPVFFSWVGDAKDQLRLVYDIRLKKFALASITRRGTAYATSPPQTFRRGSVHTLIGSWSPTSVAISVDGGSFSAVARPAPPQIGTPIFYLGAFAGNVDRAPAGFFWFAAGRGTLDTGDVRDLNQLPDNHNGVGARLQTGYDLPKFRYTSHNTFLTILVELGIVGLALFLIPWAAIVARTIGRASRRPNDRALLVGWLAAVGIYVINASFVDMRFLSLIPALPWIALGLMRRYSLRETRSPVVSS
jgi:O-antigen ligase